MDAATHAARQEADGIAAQAQGDFPRFSIPAGRRADRKDQSDSARLGEILCRGSLKSVFLVHPRLGREEDSAPSGQSLSAPRLRMEAVEQRTAEQDAWALR